MRLFTYIIRHDTGSSPNPFRGICTLAICKPKIRRVAKPGDWVAGVGSATVKGRDFSGRLIYAMKVEESISLADYDRRAEQEWPHRIPKHDGPDLSERLGDCIYGFPNDGEVVQRKGVHGKENISRDLSGKNVLISRNFYYFGREAFLIPHDLREICPKTQGHRSSANNPYAYRFEKWITNSGYEVGNIHGWPELMATPGCPACLFACAESASDEDIEES
jgi:hypothetical protein